GLPEQGGPPHHRRGLLRNLEAVPPGLPHPPPGHLLPQGHLRDGHAGDGGTDRRSRTPDRLVDLPDGRAARYAQAALRVVLATGPGGHRRNVGAARPSDTGQIATPLPPRWRKVPDLLRTESR